MFVAAIAAAAGVIAIVVGAHEALTVVVHPHSEALYVTVVVLRLVGTAVASQLDVLWQPHSSS